MDAMRTVLKEKVNLSDELLGIFTSQATYQKIKKGEIIVNAEKTCDKLFFLEKGLLRGYRLVNSTEYTHYFFFDQWFVTDYQSYLSGERGHLYIEAITDVECYVFTKERIDALFNEHHVLERLGRIIAENSYLQMVRRLVDFQTNDLKERYLNLIANKGAVINEVAQKYIASYLGVAEQSLSRIKAEIARR